MNVAASEFWIWGRRPVLEAVRSGAALEIQIAEGRKESPALEVIRREAGARRIGVRVVPPASLERLAPQQNTQGVVARVEQRTAESPLDLIRTAEERGERPLLLVLDQVQDPQNLGSLLRTANAAGAHGVILPERRTATASGVVAKVSAGASSYTPIVEVTNLARALQDVQASGTWVVGLDGDSRQTLYTVDLTEPIALVVGNEESGLRRLTKHHCDFIVKLPMMGQIQSLNAGVAGAIALYETVRQRTQRGQSR